MTTIKWEFTLGDSNADKLIKELVDMGYLQLSDERGYKYIVPIIGHINLSLVEG